MEDNIIYINLDKLDNFNTLTTLRNSLKKTNLKFSIGDSYEEYEFYEINLDDNLVKNSEFNIIKQKFERDILYSQELFFIFIDKNNSLYEKNNFLCIDNVPIITLKDKYKLLSKINSVNHNSIGGRRTKKRKIKRSKRNKRRKRSKRFKKRHN